MFITEVIVKGGVVLSYIISRGVSNFVSSNFTYMRQNIRNISITLTSVLNELTALCSNIKRGSNPASRECKGPAGDVTEPN